MNNIEKMKLFIEDISKCQSDTLTIAIEFIKNNNPKKYSDYNKFWVEMDNAHNILVRYGKKEVLGVIAGKIKTKPERVFMCWFDENVKSLQLLL